MREIKFRGKTRNGKWVYGDLVHFTNTEGVDTSVIITGHQATAESDDFDYALCYARNEFKIVIPKSVGQFTGLHDKNGKEIYEGDIIRGNCGHGEVRHLISFYDMIASFVAEMLPDNDISDYCSLSQTWILKYNKEVIGNIHDNPELLKTE